MSKENPILHLAKVVRVVVKEKNYSLRAVRQSDDEVGELVDGFNEMLNQIQLRDAALQAANDELEKRGAVRTKELARSASLLNATLDATADGILLVDKNSRVTGYNSNFVEMWHIPPELMESGDDEKALSFVVGQMKHGDIFLARVRELYAQPDAETHDILELKDGRIFERDSKPQRLNGESVGRVWSFRDITARKRTDDAQKDAQQLIEGIVNAIPVRVFWKNRDLFYMGCNTAFAKDAGSPDPSHIIGKTDYDLFPAQAELYRRDDRDVMASGNIKLFIEEPQTTPEGKIITLLTSKVPWRNAGGEIIGVLGTYMDITPLKQAEAELKQMNKQMLETSRQAGMAEIATSMLHNVGNVLNSVNVSTTLVAGLVRKSKVGSVVRLADMLSEHEADLGNFFTANPRGRQVPGYVQMLSGQLLQEQKSLLAEIDSLLKNVEHIKEIISMQQSYARVSGVSETVTAAELVEDALRINANAMTMHGIEIVQDTQSMPMVTVERNKVIQVLVNLLRNATQSCAESSRDDKRVTVRLSSDDLRFRIAVIDNGMGILPENLTRIFAHGFTTRKQGHGFGLHSGSLTARELGGSLTVESSGLGHGATFVLELPKKPKSSPVTNPGTATLSQ